jgi:hypothetical protein
MQRGARLRAFRLIHNYTMEVCLPQSSQSDCCAVALAVERVGVRAQDIANSFISKKAQDIANSFLSTVP